MPGIVREKPGVQLCETRSASRARMLRRKHFPPAVLSPARRGNDVQDAVAQIQAVRNQPGQPALLRRAHGKVPDRQLDVVFLEPVQPRPRVRINHLPVNPQPGITLPRSPLRKVGVIAFP